MSKSVHNMYKIECRHRSANSLGSRVGGRDGRSSVGAQFSQTVGPRARRAGPTGRHKQTWVQKYTDNTLLYLFFILYQASLYNISHSLILKFENLKCTDSPVSSI